MLMAIVIFLATAAVESKNVTGLPNKGDIYYDKHTGLYIGWPHYESYFDSFLSQNFKKLKKNPRLARISVNETISLFGTNISLSLRGSKGYFTGMESLQRMSRIRRKELESIDVDFDIGYRNLTLHYDRFHFRINENMYRGPLRVIIGENKFSVTALDETSIECKAWKWQQVELNGQQSCMSDTLKLLLENEKLTVESVQRKLLVRLNKLLDDISLMQLCYTC